MGRTGAKRRVRGRGVLTTPAPPPDAASRPRGPTYVLRGEELQRLPRSACLPLQCWAATARRRPAK
jgi:hypothetical protein